MIDSHVALWLVLQPNQIKKNIRDLILNNENDIYISIVSFWEISIKYNIGKLVLNGASPEIFSQELSKACKVNTLNLTLQDTLSFHNLKTFHHKDPFDRMLIWQAIQNDLTFITDDTLIHKYTDIGLKVEW
ncbi:MAG TPA: type II toxin-antitoxin system VapC family toxin [Saprospiraceae bacterium]|nr:type II toxin-antitoxin system VapC family toxin [Saprospiraceae bacterium]